MTQNTIWNATPLKDAMILEWASGDRNTATVKREAEDNMTARPTGTSTGFAEDLVPKSEMSSLDAQERRARRPRLWVDTTVLTSYQRSNMARTAMAVALKEPALVVRGAVCDICGKTLSRSNSLPRHKKSVACLKKKRNMKKLRNREGGCDGTVNNVETDGWEDGVFRRQLSA